MKVQIGCRAKAQETGISSGLTRNGFDRTLGVVYALKG